MGVTFILVISILIQFAAAFLALKLIWITGRRVAWVLIATDLFFNNGVMMYHRGRSSPVLAFPRDLGRTL